MPMPAHQPKIMSAPANHPPGPHPRASADATEYPRNYVRLGGHDLFAMRPPASLHYAEHRFHSVHDLQRRLNAEPAVPLTALIFHCARCGSTLLARMLELEPENRVFAEPASLPRFLGANEAALMRGEAVSGLRTFIQAFGLEPSAQERRLILKLTSRSIAYLPAFRAAFPEVPFIYLFREPAEVVASICATPPAFLRGDQRDSVAASFGATSAGLAEMNPAEWFAWYVGTNLRHALRYADQFADVIDYKNHSQGYLTAANRFSNTPKKAEDFSSLLTRHSKNLSASFAPPDKNALTEKQKRDIQALAGEAYSLWTQKSRGV